MFSVGSLGQSQDLTVKIDSAVTAISQTSALDKKQGYRDLNLFIVRQGGSKSGELYEYLLKKDTTELGQMMILFGYSKIISSTVFCRNFISGKIVQIKKSYIVFYPYVKETELI